MKFLEIDKDISFLTNRKCGFGGDDEEWLRKLQNTHEALTSEQRKRKEQARRKPEQRRITSQRTAQEQMSPTRRLSSESGSGSEFEPEFDYLDEAFEN
jgi:hypothetical protein